MPRKDHEKESSTGTKLNYIGWVPCIGGHLDFGLISPGISGKFTGSGRDRQVSCVNFSPTEFADSHVRNIAIQSWVDWNDTYKKADGTSRVCLIAKVKESSSLDNRRLKGSIIIYRKSYEGKRGRHKARLIDAIHDLAYTKASWDAKDFGVVDKAKHFFSSFFVKYLKGHRKRELTYRRFTSESEYKSQLKARWSKIEELVPAKGGKKQLPEQLVLDELATKGRFPNIYRVDFEVSPDGIARLGFHDLGTHHLGETEIGSEDRFVICRQAFYYLKYSLHTHKHHGQQQDAMTTIVQDNDDAGLRILGQIKRELTGIKRLQRYKMQRHHSAEALGIIAYSKSLCETLKLNGCINQEIAKRESSRLSFLEASFTSQLDSLSERFKLKETYKGNARFWTTLCLAGVSFFIILSMNLTSIIKVIRLPEELISILASENGLLSLFLAAFILPATIYGAFIIIGKLQLEWRRFWKLIYNQYLFFLVYAILLVSPALTYVYLLLSRNYSFMKALSSPFTGTLY